MSCRGLVLLGEEILEAEAGFEGGGGRTLGSSVLRRFPGFGRGGVGKVAMEGYGAFASLSRASQSGTITAAAVATMLAARDRTWISRAFGTGGMMVCWRDGVGQLSAPRRILGKVA